MAKGWRYPASAPKIGAPSSNAVQSPMQRLIPLVVGIILSLSPQASNAQQAALVDSLKRGIVGSWISVEKSSDGMEIDSMYAQFTANGATTWRAVRTTATETGKKRHAGSPRVGRWRVVAPLDPKDDRVQVCVSMPKQPSTDFCSMATFHSWDENHEYRSLLDLLGGEQLKLGAWSFWRVESLFVVKP